MVERRKYLPYTYEGLKALAKRLGRPVKSLLALADQNDPFYADGPTRRKMAEWFAGLWQRYDLVSCSHLRAMHYRLISQLKGSVRFPDRTMYENTHENWVKLIHASRDARHLGLVPDDWKDRKANALIYLVEPTAAVIGYAHRKAYDDLLPEQPPLPALAVNPPTNQQPYHLELWCEKTTMNDILEALGEQYRLNVITGEGEISHTQCVDLVERALKSGLPVRILYISDFDPKGQGMPVSVARKIEHILYRRGLKLDIQIRNVALTHEQCQRFQLPRTPIKDTERSKDGFEQRWGEGATELDALEALHPGALHDILVTEIERYFDPDLEEAIETSADELREELDAITEDVHAEHQDKIDELNTAWADIAARIGAWKEQVETVYQDITDALDERRRDVNAHEWPEAGPADEDDDPLFDSTREYVEQMDRYKEHQNKPTEGENRSKQND